MEIYWDHSQIAKVVYSFEIDFESVIEWIVSELWVNSFDLPSRLSPWIELHDIESWYQTQASSIIAFVVVISPSVTQNKERQLCCLLLTKSVAKREKCPK